MDRLVGQLRVAGELGGSRGAGLARALGVPPFVAVKLAEQARRFSPRVLAEAQLELAKVDRWLKSSGSPGRLALEGFVMSLCRDS